MRVLTHTSERVLIESVLAAVAKAAADDPRTRRFLVVPEPMKADIERRCLEITRDGVLLQTDVVSFRRLVFRLAAEVGGLGAKRLTGVGRALLIGAMLRQHRHRFIRLAALANQSGYVFALSTLLETLAEANVDAAALHAAAQAERTVRARERLTDLATLHTLVNEAIAARGYVDAIDDTARVIRALETPEIETPLSLRTAHVIVLGYGELTPLRAIDLDLLHALERLGMTLTLGLVDGPGPAYEGARATIKRVKARFSPSIQTIKASSPAPTKHHTVVYASSVDDEAAYVAGEIRRLWLDEGCALSTIAIALCDPASATVVDETLRRFEVPAFLDQKGSLAATPFARYVDHLLSLTCLDTGLETVLRLLKNPLSGVDRDSVNTLENDALAVGALDLSRLKTRLSDRPYAAAVFSFLDRVERLGVALRGERKGGAKVERLRAFFLAEPGLMDRIAADIKGDVERRDTLVATTSAQGVNAWFDALDEAETLLADDVVAHDAFCLMVREAVLRTSLKSIPVGLDRVRIGPLPAIVRYPADVVFLMGVTPNTYPVGDEEASFLTHDEQDRLSQVAPGFVPNRRHQRQRALALDRRVASLARRALYVTVPDSTVDRPLTWLSETHLKEVRLTPDVPDIHWNHASEAAIRLLRLAHASPEAPHLEAWREALKALGEDVSIASAQPFGQASETARLDEATLATALRRTSIATVTTLQTYNSCPFTFFANHLLKLKARPEAKSDAALQGRFLHVAMHHAVDVLLKDPAVATTDEAAWAEAVATWRTRLNDAATVRRIEALTCDTLKEPVLTLPGADVRTIERLRTFWLHLVDRLAQRFATGVKPYALEHVFGNEAASALCVPSRFDGVTHRLHGMIDRIDRTPEGDVLIDYKRGQYAFDLANYLSGVDIQLPLYAYAWDQATTERPVVGFMYSSFKDDANKDEAKTADAWHAYPLAATDVWSIVTATVAGIEAGWMAATPVAKRQGGQVKVPCDTCSHKAFCAYDPLAPHPPAASAAPPSLGAWLHTDTKETKTL